MTIRIGTRRSKLAMWQAEAVRTALVAHFPDMNVELVQVSTHGDRDQKTPLERMSMTGIFTKRLEDALLNNEADVAVHSLKDMPTLVHPGLSIAACLPRGDAQDALISRHALSIADLPRGGTVATGSLRRRAQVLAQRPDLFIAEVRGNVETRLSKFYDNGWDGMIMAAAGLKRIGLESHIAAQLDYSEMVPAPAQGVIAAQCRASDDRIQKVLEAINDPNTEACAIAERALMRRLEGGCQVPIGAHATVVGSHLTLEAIVAAVDGGFSVRGSTTGSVDDAEEKGVKLAEDLISRGADEILEAIRTGRTNP